MAASWNKLLVAGVLSLAVGAYGFLPTAGPRTFSTGRGLLARSNPAGLSVSLASRSRPTFTLNMIGSASKRSNAKRELLAAIEPLDRGVQATEEDEAKVEKLAQELEKLNPNPKSLASPLINGRWELVYTTSAGILGKGKPRRLRPWGPIYQDIDASGLRAKNHQVLRPLPLIRIPNSVRAALTPTSPSAVNVQFIQFRFGPIKIKAPKNAKGALDTTYVDEEVRVSRGDKGNLFVLSKPEGLEPEFS